MSAFKKIVVVLSSLIFGTVLLLGVSYAVSLRSQSVMADTGVQSWEYDTEKLQNLDLTVELGKVRIVPGEGEQIKVTCTYPAKDYLDNQVRVLADRDKENLHLRVNSKRKAYFFGLIKDKACDIKVEIPDGLLPALSIKIQAGELMVDGPALSDLQIDGDIAEIEVRNPKTEQIRISNNVGTVTAYLSNLEELTHKSLSTSVNVGDIDLHLETTDERGYQLDYIYNIGALSTQDGKQRGFGKNESMLVRKRADAVYQVKTDIGTIHVYEDQTPGEE